VPAPRCIIVRAPPLGLLNFLIPSTARGGVAGSTENCVRHPAINLLHVRRARRSYLHIGIHSRPGTGWGGKAKSSSFTERHWLFLIALGIDTFAFSVWNAHAPICLRNNKPRIITPTWRELISFSFFFFNLRDYYKLSLCVTFSNIFCSLGYLPIDQRWLESANSPQMDTRMIVKQ